MDMHFEGVVFHTYAAELSRRITYPHPPFAVLDVRDAAAFDRERIPGSLLYGTAETQLPPGTTETTEFFIVGAGLEDAAVRNATLSLRKSGARRIVEVIGGMHEWKQQGLPLERAKRDTAA
ncbi:MAG: hypothetical protein OES47_02385 [Acidobacteriota bacterium]|nr:hypothetical protein [Acidobacteriota bacterium]